MLTNNVKISGEIDKQLLGLTDLHIQCITNESLSSSDTNGSTQGATNQKIGIHQQMISAFNSLKESAKIAGIELKIASGYRSFERQLQIWNNKFTGVSAIKDLNGNTIDISTLSAEEVIESILLYSALPGASRHHWGCDIDVYAPNLLSDNTTLKLEPWEYQESGPMEKLSTWLSQNASEFGFYLPYDKYRGGVAEEPWHLSFLPLAKQYQAAFNLQVLQACLMNTNIAGKIEIIERLPEIAKRYITNVNTEI